MPWLETDPMEERMRFIVAHEQGLYSMTELCGRYGISRQAGYDVLKRYRAEGIEGLKDRSHAPRHCPHKISPRGSGSAAPASAAETGLGAQDAPGAPGD